MIDWTEVGRHLAREDWLSQTPQQTDPTREWETVDLTVEKRPGVVSATREMLLDAGLVEPTAEERAQAERDRAEWERREVERVAKLAAARTALAALTDPLTRVTLDLHAEGPAGECEGCDWAGMEGEPGAWPCRTVEAVARHYGIEMP